MPHLIKSLIEISNARELVEKYKTNQYDQYRPLKAIIFAAEEQKAFKNYIQNNWDLLNELSGEYCDLFTIVHKEDRVPLLDATGNEIPLTSTIKRCREIASIFFESKKVQQIKYPCIFLFNEIGDGRHIYFDCSGMNENQLDSFFQNLLNELKIYKTENFFYTTEEIYLRLRSNIRTKRIISKIKLVIYDIPFDRISKIARLLLIIIGTSE